MSGLVCLPCGKFFRPKKNGVWIEEGMPISKTEWGPYKIWQADLVECPSCRTEVVTGFGMKAAVEHFQPDYSKFREMAKPIARIDDCGGLMP